MRSLLLFLLLGLSIQQVKKIDEIECHEGYLVRHSKDNLYFQFIGREIDDDWEYSKEDVTKFFWNGQETTRSKLPNRPLYVVTVWQYRGVRTWRLLQVRVITRYEKR
jgi:hypothetical protein